jgi:hypothetical protein
MKNSKQTTTEKPASEQACPEGPSLRAGRDRGGRRECRWPRAQDAKPKAAADAKPKAAGEHLKPGQLDGLVLDFLRENEASGPHGPTTVAKALNRSAGATSNCLTRLTKAKEVRQDNEKPRRYSLRQFGNRARAPHSPPRSGGDEGPRTRGSP